MSGRVSIHGQFKVLHENRAVRNVTRPWVEIQSRAGARGIVRHGDPPGFRRAIGPEEILRS